MCQLPFFVCWCHHWEISPQRCVKIGKNEMQKAHICFSYRSLVQSGYRPKGNCDCYTYACWVLEELLVNFWTVAEPANSIWIPVWNVFLMLWSKMSVAHSKIMMFVLDCIKGKTWRFWYPNLATTKGFRGKQICSKQIFFFHNSLLSIYHESKYLISISGIFNESKVTYMNSEKTLQNEEVCHISQCFLLQCCNEWHLGCQEAVFNSLFCLRWLGPWCLFAWRTSSLKGISRLNFVV